MTARRIARELAVIVLPQLPKDQSKIQKLEIEDLVGRAVMMLTGHVRDILETASSELLKVSTELDEIELAHPDNATKLENLHPVTLTTEQLRNELQHIDRAVNLLSEALEMPELTMHSGRSRIEIPCSKCKHVSTVVLDRNDKSEVRNFLIELITAYIQNRSTIDQFIKSTRSKWKMERMVSIDRDILRMACAEAFFMPEIPVKVAINEAVELCHRFADARAAKLINGILADLVEEAEYFRETGELRLGSGSGSNGGSDSNGEKIDSNGEKVH
jgi:N utilization substance protein B